MTRLADLLATGGHPIALGEQVEWLEPLGELALAASTREWLRLGGEWIFWFKPEMSSATTSSCDRR